MSLTRSVENSKIILLQPLQPSGKLSFGFLELPEPGEGAVVRSQCEVRTQQVRAEVLHKRDYSQQFSSGDTIASLLFGQDLASIGDDLLLTILDL